MTLPDMPEDAGFFSRNETIYEDKTMTRAELHFTLERETKGAVRYAESGVDLKDPDSYLIGTLYLRKSKLRSMGHATAPAEIRVTVDTVQV